MIVNYTLKFYILTYLNNIHHWSLKLLSPLSILENLRLILPSVLNHYRYLTISALGSNSILQAVFILATIMLKSTQTQVQNMATTLGCLLTSYTIEDIANKVENSNSVIKHSKELSLVKVVDDLKIFCYTSLFAFFAISGVPIIVCNLNPEFTQQTIEESVTKGVDVFQKIFTALFLLELIWITTNLYQEYKATQKMILYFLLRRVDVKK